MVPLSARVLRTIRRHELIPRGSRVLVAVSGGCDSVALLHLLLGLQAVAEFTVSGVVHVHHGLRGAAADNDEALCRELAASLGLPTYVEHIDVGKLARDEARSLEDAGRSARADVFARAVEALDSQRIAVGHTRDDQAETVLLKLFRGAGTRGLLAIHPRVGSLVRPLLDVGRTELREWLAEQDLPFSDDETNDDVRFRRNAVRHTVLPVIQGEFGPGVTAALARQAEIAREDEHVLASLAAPLVARAVRADEPNIAVDCAHIAAAPPALQRRVVLEALRRVGVKEPGLDHTLAVLAVAAGESRRLDLPGDVVATMAGTTLLLTRRGPAEAPVAAFRYQLPVPGSVWVPEAGRTVSAHRVELEGPDAPRDLAAMAPDSALVEAHTLTPGLVVRNWNRGDRLRPLGLTGRKKLQDLFVDRKVPRAERVRVPLVVDQNDRIVWVPGHAIDEMYRVTSDTRAVVVLTVRESGGRE